MLGNHYKTVGENLSTFLKLGKLLFSYGISMCVWWTKKWHLSSNAMIRKVS